MAPPGAALHWQLEVRRWAPGFSAVTLTSPVTEKALRRLTPYDVVVVTPDVMRANVQVLATCRWLFVIGDASMRTSVPQNNPGTARMVQQARAAQAGAAGGSPTS